MAKMIFLKSLGRICARVLLSLLLLYTHVAIAQNDDRLKNTSSAVEALVQQGRYEEASKLGIQLLVELGEQPPTTEGTARLLLETGGALIRQGSVERAQPLLEQALNIQNKLGFENILTAQILVKLAELALMQNNQVEKAFQLLLRAINILEKTPGQNDFAMADALGDLSKAYGRQGNLEKALELGARSLSMLERAKPDATEVGIESFNLSLIHFRLGHFDKALPLQLKALGILENKFGSNHQDVASVLNGLAFTYGAMADHAKALPMMERAVLITQNIYGPDHPRNVEGYVLLANLLNALAEYDRGMTMAEHALAIAEAMDPPDDVSISAALFTLSWAYGYLGNFEQAIKLQKRWLSILEKSPDKKEDTANALGELAASYTQLAQPEISRPLIQRSLEMTEKMYGLAHPLTATRLLTLAETYTLTGQYSQALEIQQRALTIREKVLGSDHPTTAKALTLLARTYISLNQHEEALLRQRRALAIYESAFGFGPYHPETATALNNLARTYDSLSQYAEALALQRRALAISEKVYGEDHPLTALTLSNTAVTLISFKQYEEALELTRRALVINVKLLGPDHPMTALTWSNFAVTMSFLQQKSAAIFAMKRAVNSYQTQRKRISSFAEAELSNYTASVSGHYRLLASWLVDDGRIAEALQVQDMLKENEQFDFIRRSSSADTQRTIIGFNSTEQAWLTRYSAVSDKLAAISAEEQLLQKQARRGLTPEQTQRLKALTADLKFAKLAFGAYLAEMREGFKARGPARAVELVETSETALRELQTMLKDLGPDVALLKYIVTDEKLDMVLLLPGVPIVRSSRVSAKDLNRQIFKLHSQLADPESSPLPIAQSLYKLLLGPVENDLTQAKIKTVMVFLDGELRYLPIGALHDGKQYALERWNLPIYTSVTKDRLRDSVGTQWQVAGLGVTKAHVGFPALPSVRDELGNIVRAAVGSTNGAVPGEVYLDEAFDAKRLMDVGQRPFNLVHVASHFQFGSGGTELNSFLLLGDGQHLTLADIRTQNYRFDKVDLLTLAACNTGLGSGRNEKGQEIEGFGVIAQQQGAKAVLATLWSVEDKSTSILMADMYRRRQSQQLSKIEALRQAQIALMQQPKYQHPFYWGAFILMGNWK